MTGGHQQLTFRIVGSLNHLFLVTEFMQDQNWPKNFKLIDITAVFEASENGWLDEIITNVCCSFTTY